MQNVKLPISVPMFGRMHFNLVTIFLSIFFFALFASIPCFVRSELFKEDVFGDGARFEKRERMALDVADILGIKFSHAKRSPAFEYAVFGNSRSVAIAAENLSLEPSKYFNFSVGGTSFEQSIVLLRELQSANRLPRNIIISIDNFDLVYFGPPYFPNAFSLTGWVLDLIHADLSERKLPHSRIHTFLDQVVRQVVNYFNLDRMLRQINFLLNIGATHKSQPYRADGSLAEFPGVENTNIKFPQVPEVSASDVRTLMKSLDFIFSLQAEGRKIIIYESPIHPSLFLEVESQRSGTVANARSRFYEKCRQLNLTCLSPPVIESDLPWLDCCHAPARDLSAYLRQFI